MIKISSMVASCYIGTTDTGKLANYSRDYTETYVKDVIS